MANLKRKYVSITKKKKTAFFLLILEITFFKYLSQARKSIPFFYVDIQIFRQMNGLIEIEIDENELNFIEEDGWHHNDTMQNNRCFQNTSTVMATGGLYHCIYLFKIMFFLSFSHF